MIEVENLTKYYASFPALRGVSFRVEAGEIVGFLGPNGAGKTTTLRILTGFMPATEGRVTVAGFDVIRQSREVRRHTGYLPEDVPLYRDMTVRAFLRYLGGLKEIPGRSLGEEVERVMGLTGLEPVADLLISKCSRGYRQRTGIALALLGDPPVLLLDEPTSGLDPNQVVEVRDLVRRLSGEKTVLLSSHVLSEVAQICGRVFIVDHGRLVASGTPEDLSRRYGTEQRLFLRIQGGPPQSVLEAVDGVVRVERRSARGGFLLAARDAETVAPAVAAAVLAAGGKLIELRHEGVDLETIFRAATLGDGNA